MPLLATESLITQWMPSWSIQSTNRRIWLFFTIYLVVSFVFCFSVPTPQSDKQAKKQNNLTSNEQRTTMIKQECTHVSFASLFNNQKYSDLQIRFPKSGNVLFAHRAVLCDASDFFKACFDHDMLESREGVVTLDEDDDEQLVNQLIKSLYFREIEIEDNTHIVPSILLAEKYQLRTLVPTLVSMLIDHLDLKRNILQCMQLPLENEAYKELRNKVQSMSVQHARTIFEGESYLMLSLDHFTTGLNILTNKDNRVDAFDAVQSWIEANVDNRKQYSFQLSQIIRQAKNREPPYASFDSNCSKKHFELSNDNKRIRRISGENYSGYHGSGFVYHNYNSSESMRIFGTKSKDFSIRLIRNCSRLRIGMARKLENTSSSGGYVLQSATDGMIVRVQLINNQLKFSNGENHLQSCTVDSSSANELFPAFDVQDLNCEFEFVPTC